MDKNIKRFCGWFNKRGENDMATPFDARLYSNNFNKEMMTGLI